MNFNRQAAKPAKKKGKIYETAKPEFAVAQCVPSAELWFLG
jgi:hypothetical protein